jgi:hypothetical protein
MYIARQSDYIQEDIKRGFSSWNFGAEGLNATAEQIEEWRNDAIENESPFYISGFELWGNDIKNADIRELYTEYWVLVDERFSGSICGTKLKSENFTDAITEMKQSDYFGDGVRIDLSEAKLVYSEGNLHLFEI